MLTISVDTSAISVDTSAEQPFRAAGILPYFSLPSEKKILCPFHLRSGYDFHSLDLGRQKSLYTTLWITRGFPPVLIPQCYVTALKFKNHAAIHRPKKQRCFGSSQLCPLADIPFFELYVYFIFNLQNYFLRFLNFSLFFYLVGVCLKTL